MIPKIKFENRFSFFFYKKESARVNLLIGLDESSVKHSLRGKHWSRGHVNCVFLFKNEIKREKKSYLVHKHRVGSISKRKQSVLRIVNTSTHKTRTKDFKVKTKHTSFFT